MRVDGDGVLNEWAKKQRAEGAGPLLWISEMGLVVDDQEV
jgi:hypothetical protein